MCGGMILTFPCSRAGFLYTMESPLLSLQMVKNREVIAESLMDHYKEHFYNANFITDGNETIKKFDANINATKTLRQKLNCNSFDWYMKNIYYDKMEPRADSQYAGLVIYQIVFIECLRYTRGMCTHLFPPNLCHFNNHQ